MVYGPRKKKISQFTAGTAITDDVKYSSLQDGINKTFTQEQLIADFADVYGASLRTFEFESDLVVSDIQIDEYCIVEENRYTLYKITSAAANLPNIGLDSGFTAERVRILQQASPSTYAEILAENPDLYAEDDVIYLSGDGIADDFKVVAGAIADSSTGVLLSNATWNAAGKHLERAFENGVVNVTWFGAIADDSGFDSYAAFQAALDYLGFAGGKITIPAGTYYLSASAAIDSRELIVQGVGAATKIQGYSGFVGPYIKSLASERLISGTFLENVKIKDLQLVGISKTGTAIALTGFNRGCALINVTIQSFDKAVEIAGSFSWFIEHCYFSNNNYGLYAGYSSTGLYNGENDVNAFVVRDTTIKNCTNTGVSVFEGFANTVTGSTIEVNAKHFELFNVETFNIVDNYMETATGRAIHVGDATFQAENVNVHRNRIMESVNRPGVVLYNAASCNISDNIYGTTITKNVYIEGDAPAVRNNRIELATNSPLGGTYAAVAYINNEVFSFVTDVTAVSSLGSGWSNEGGNLPPLSYWEDKAGFVHIQGAITGGTLGFPNTVFNMPTGLRPGYDIYQPAHDGHVSVSGNGDFIVRATTSGASRFLVSYKKSVN